MLQHQPSRTAEYMAMFRASEHAKGAGRRVFTDPLAVALLPGSLRLSAKLLAVRPVGEMLTRYIDRQWPGARTSGIARTRLIDDWIEESIGQAEQVVLLGAGFDTRAWPIAKVDGSGEPWRFGLLPDELPDFLRERGLRLVSDLGADQYRERVMGQAGRHMLGYSFYHTVLAEVGDA